MSKWSVFRMSKLKFRYWTLLRPKYCAAARGISGPAERNRNKAGAKAPSLQARAANRAGGTGPAFHDLVQPPRKREREHAVHHAFHPDRRGQGPVDDMDGAPVRLVPDRHHDPAPFGADPLEFAQRANRLRGVLQRVRAQHGAEDAVGI